MKTLIENPRAFKNTYWDVPNYSNALMIDSELFINVIKSIHHRTNVVLGLFRWAEWEAEKAFSVNLHCVADVLIDGYLKCDVSVKLHDLLLWVYSKKSDVKHCLIVFHKMVGSRFLPDVKNCNRTLRILRDRNLVGKAREVYGMMGDIGIEPTIVTYNTMLDLFCKKSEVLQALDLLLEMQRRDFCPNDFTYNVLINGLSKKGEFDQAKELIVEMLNKRLKVSAYTYNPLVCGYCHKGMLIEALGLREEMEVRGALPSISTYNAFMHGFCKLGRVSDARMWIPVMLKRNLVPDVVTYNTLIYGHCQLGDVTEALFLLFEMRRRNVDPTLYNDGWIVQHGDLDGAMRLKDEMIDYGIFPDAFSYTVLIEGSYKAGNLLMAKKVFDEMVSEGVEPDRLSYTTCITGELKLGE
ncbi:pentatricopeptide repeat-containing protein At1g22960, mitochondrial-like [Olea europaea var. sylvestris]|uniref:pentatricopeptide repeat-containing protein At1g22960, mitochondrial-like n=1 Tax=Olea europaea var. sylvestris TaxID=158386 RepID=UPI000C1D426C|nr:pentatricopeptide repeat-containing protein At1g22960, mitochondrial-like [Olea europaea var. sylvestris]